MQLIKQQNRTFLIRANDQEALAIIHTLIHQMEGKTKNPGKKPLEITYANGQYGDPLEDTMMTFELQKEAFINIDPDTTIL